MLKQKTTVGLARSLKNVAFFLLIALCTAPDGLYYAAPALDAVVDKLQLFSGLAIALLFILYLSRSGSIKTITIFMFAFWLDILVMTYVNEGNLNDIIIQMLKIFVLICSVNIYKDHLMDFLGIIILILEIQIIANLYYMITYPQGMLYLVSEKFKYIGAHWWLLGFDDRSNSIFFPAIGFELVYAILSKKKLRLLLLLAVIHVEAFLSVSGATIAGLVLIDLVLIFRLWKHSNVLNYRNVMILLVVVNVLMISLSGNNGFTKFITSILGKSIDTMSGRHWIWTRAMEMIGNNVLFGYGQMSDARLQSEVYVNTILHSHNMLLEILFKGGIVLMTLFGAIMIHVGKTMMKFKTSQPAQMLLLALSAMMITAIFAPIIFGKWAMWASLLICMCAYVDRLEGQILEKES